MQLVVVGMGLFGTAVAEGAAELGVMVLALDSRPEVVQAIADKGKLHHVAQVDARDQASLRRAGVGPEYQIGVVGIGTDLESSVMATIHLKDLGVGRIMAKALHETHRKILEKVGAESSMIPEIVSGQTAVRRMLYPGLQAEVQFGPDYSVVELKPPPGLIGKQLGQSRLREDHKANLIGLRRGATTLFELGPETVIQSSDIMLLGIPRDALDRFLSATGGRAR